MQNQQPSNDEIVVDQPETSPQEPPKEEKKEPGQKAEVSLIPVNSEGKVVARNNSELLRYCGALVTAEAVPDRFNNPTKLFGALMYVRSLNLPDVAIRQVANIHGSMSIFGDLPLALIQRSGKLTHFKEQWFDKDYNVICFENKNLTSEVFGSVTFMRREDGEIQSFSFTVEDARKAKLIPARKRNGDLNPDSPWEKYQPQMLRYRSRGLGAKSLFADCINGALIAEFDFDHEAPGLTGIRDVTQSQDRDELIDKLEKRANSTMEGSNVQKENRV